MTKKKSGLRVEFTLSMPGAPSWNGKWSGEGRNYVVYRTVSRRTVDAWASTRWSHCWKDGWRAVIDARVMDKGERRKKSAGFAGYEWMVDNIIRRCTPYNEGTTP